jgi:DNA topoisomerase-3
VTPVKDCSADWLRRADRIRVELDFARDGDATSIDEGRLGDCPRCGRPVITGKRGLGCSGWREGCPFVL